MINDSSLRVAIARALYAISLTLSVLGVLLFVIPSIPAVLKAGTISSFSVPLLLLFFVPAALSAGAAALLHIDKPRLVWFAGIWSIPALLLLVFQVRFAI